MTNNTPGIDLRQLRYFVVLAEELHFGRAATRLNLAQPSLTRQIQLLEQYLGFALLNRTQRQVMLTEAGQVFLEQVRLTLEQHERSIEIATNTAKQQEDTLTIGFESCAAFHGLPQVLREFTRGNPHIKVISYQLTAPEQEEALLRGSIDAGFLHPPVLNKQLTFEKVLEETIIAVLPSTHPLAKHRSVALSVLAAESFILFPRKLAPACFDIMMSLCTAAGFVPRVQHETSDLAFCLNLIAKGNGVTLAPACVKESRIAGVVYRKLNQKTAQVESGFARRSGAIKPSLVQLLQMWKSLGMTQCQ